MNKTASCGVNRAICE